MKRAQQINTETTKGKQLEDDLRPYPEAVQFRETAVVSEPTPQAYETNNEGFHQAKETIKSISATESAKLAFEKLGKKYNCTFDNKYTK